MQVAPFSFSHLALRYHMYPFFQIDGVNSIRIGKISNLPRSMSRQRISLENGEKNARFSVGPAIFRPGPTLLKQVVTAVIFVAKSKSLIEIRMKDPNRIKIYRIMKLATLRVTSDSILYPSNLIRLTERG